MCALVRMKLTGLQHLLKGRKSNYVYQIKISYTSVLIRLYPNPSNGASWTVSTVHTTFIDNINSNSYVISYPGQSNIRALNLTLSNQFQNIIQPGYPSSDEAIPMNLAVFIGSWPCEYNTITNHYYCAFYIQSM